jgi:hypothetical protein
MKKLVALLVLLTGCGQPTPKSPSPNPPPPSPMPLTADWKGNMNFTVVSGSLDFSLTEDTAFNLSGTASSTPPDCQFSLSVTGKVNGSNMFLQSSDNTTVSLVGTISPDLKSIAGNINLGSGTGCGPRTSGSWSVQKQ